MSTNKIYLGDSVYAELEDDKIRLTTDNGFHDDPRNVIFLEREVYAMFRIWVEKEVKW